MSKINFTQQTDGSYAVTTTVANNFNLHVEFAEGGEGTYAVQVEAKTTGTKYAPVASLKGAVIDEDFDGVVYPKSIRIVASREVADAYITEK